jgi:hypothetical protein
MTACGGCGFDYEDLPVDEVPGVLRGFAASYRAALQGSDDEAVRARPAPGVWSALEYACHVRDLLLVQRERLVQAQVAERPSLAPMSRDDRVAICAYDAQPANEVVDQLEMAAGLLALALEAVGPDGWRRELLYNFPAPMARDVGWVGIHTVHECVHHLHDIERGLDVLGSGGGS